MIGDWVYCTISVRYGMKNPQKCQTTKIHKNLFHCQKKIEPLIHTLYGNIIMDFIIELQRYYRKMICKNTRYNYQDKKELANEVLSFIKKKQYMYDYVIEYEYTIYPDQENKGIGDIRISFDDVIIVIELKVIHLQEHMDQEKLNEPPETSGIKWCNR